jgi:hypothetical protein
VWRCFDAVPDSAWCTSWPFGDDFIGAPAVSWAVCVIP